MGLLFYTLCSIVRSCEHNSSETVVQNVFIYGRIVSHVIEPVMLPFQTYKLCRIWDDFFGHTVFIQLHLVHLSSLKKLLLQELCLYTDTIMFWLRINGSRQSSSSFLFIIILFTYMRYINKDNNYNNHLYFITLTVNLFKRYIKTKLT